MILFRSSYKDFVFQVLHGEQYTEILNPIPTQGAKLLSKFTIRDILDKGSGCLVLMDILTKDADSGLDLIRNQVSIFAMGMGNFGGKRKSDKIISTQDPPSSPPEMIKEFKTHCDQVHSCLWFPHRMGCNKFLYFRQPCTG